MEYSLIGLLLTWALVASFLLWIEHKARIQAEDFEKVFRRNFQEADEKIAYQRDNLNAKDETIADLTFKLHQAEAQLADIAEITQRKRTGTPTCYEVEPR